MPAVVQYGTFWCRLDSRSHQALGLALVRAGRGTRGGRCG